MHMNAQLETNFSVSFVAEWGYGVSKSDVCNFWFPPRKLLALYFLFFPQEGELHWTKKWRPIMKDGRATPPFQIANL